MTDNLEPSLTTCNACLKTCDICGRPLKRPIRAYGVTYCYKHWRQWHKYGKILDRNPRTAFDANEIRVNCDVAYVDLYDKNCNVVATAIIDAEDIPKVRYDKWRYSHGYANYATRKKGSMMMHRKILGTDDFVDHINGNKLDNRKANLRIANKSQNAMNVNYKGVSVLPTGKFYAHIKIAGRMFNLGHYELRTEALFARWYAETLLFKEYRYQKDKPVLSGEREADIKAYVDRKVQRL